MPGSNERRHRNRNYTNKLYLVGLAIVWWLWWLMGTSAGGSLFGPFSPSSSSFLTAPRSGSDFTWSRSEGGGDSGGRKGTPETAPAFPTFWITDTPFPIKRPKATLARWFWWWCCRRGWRRCRCCCCWCCAVADWWDGESPLRWLHTVFSSLKFCSLADSAWK